MTYLNIQTETKNYYIQFDYKSSATDLWYDVENYLSSDIVDSVIDYKRSKNPKGQEIVVDFTEIRTARRLDTVIKRSPRQFQIRF